jgi:hypothetical protein
VTQLGLLLGEVVGRPWPFEQPQHPASAFWQAATASSALLCVLLSPAWQPLPAGRAAAGGWAEGGQLAGPCGQVLGYRAPNRWPQMAKRSSPLDWAAAAAPLTGVAAVEPQVGPPRQLLGVVLIPIGSAYALMSSKPRKDACVEMNGDACNET